MEAVRCECPSEGVLYPEGESLYNPVTELPFVKHEPGECRCTNDLKPYLRDGKRIILCSCCWLLGDKEVE